MLESGRLELPGLLTTHLQGELRLAAPWTNPLFGGRRWAPSPAPLLREAHLASRGKVTFTTALAALGPLLREIGTAYKIKGTSTYELNLDVTPDGLKARGAVSADQSSFSVDLNNETSPLLKKTPDMSAGLAFELQVSRDENRDLVCRLQRADLEMDSNTGRCTGTIVVRDPFGEPVLDHASLQTTFRIANARGLERILPRSGWHVESGSCDGSIQFTGDPGGLKVRSGQVNLRGIALQTPAEPIRLDGSVSLAGRELKMDALKMRWGLSDAAISGALTIPPGPPTGRLSLPIEQLDLPDLQSRLAHLRAAHASGHNDLIDLGGLRVFISSLRDADLRIDAFAGRARFVLPLQVGIMAEAGTFQAAVRDGRARLDFRGRVDGGFVTGQVTSDVTAHDPQFHLAYTADKLQPGSLVDRYLALTFPGMCAQRAVDLDG